MLEVDQIDVTLEGTRVLKSASLTVPNGGLVGLLGPSGSGKTTLLRAIAGLVALDSGDIRWNAESVQNTPTHQRDFGLMFQGYALFPHLDVARNVEFGLRMAKAPDRRADVAMALEWVGLDGYGSRSIDSLSGGEKQRVALARTLAPNPRLVMLDEPLGALDRNLRLKLVNDTRAILEDRGVTAIVVTHDREEAVALTDRLALMRDGTVVQSGLLEELLSEPRHPWVRDFLK
jgi:ABC-type Fe3+/spermidine/putrescine transport system ATPase subunit